MEKGLNYTTKSIIKELNSTERYQEIELFCQEASTANYIEYKDTNQIKEQLDSKVNLFIDSLSEEELENIRIYTGYSFKFINNVLRYKWNYHENALLTEEKETYYRKLAEDIYQVLLKFPPLEKNIKTYRGVSLRAFSDYGISSLEELIHMKDKYMYESGFSSSSLIRSNSFYEKKQDFAEFSNIELEILIPGNCQDGALLLNDNLSYSTNQIEYVINSGSLSRVLDVTVDKENNRAYLKLLLIPRSFWDPYQLETSLKK